MLAPQVLLNFKRKYSDSTGYVLQAYESCGWQEKIVMYTTQSQRNNYLTTVILEVEVQGVMQNPPKILRV